MDKKIKAWIAILVIGVAFAGQMAEETASAIVIDKVLLKDTFSNDGSQPTLADRWNSEWISNDEPNYTHFAIVADPTSYSGGVLRIQYGTPAQYNGGISYISFQNGSNGQIKYYNMKYLRESVDIYMPDSNSDNFRLYLMSGNAPNPYFYIAKNSYTDYIVINYDNTANHGTSVNTTVKAPIGQWFRITAEFYANKTTANITIKNMATDSTLYSKSFSDVKIADNEFYFYIGDDETNDGNYIYIDNAMIVTKQDVAGSPLPPNPLKDAVSGSPVMILAFIALLGALAVSFYIKHWATVIMIFLFTWILSAMFLLPYFSITGNENLMISAGLSTVLAGIKYYSVRDQLKSMFVNKNASILIAIAGIVVLFLLLFFTT